MAARSTEQVKRELESERERLETAVGALRSKAVVARRKLPLVAVGVAGTGLVLRAVTRRVFRRRGQGRDSRARLPFLDDR
jgi:hypothetical protein